jgi:FtsP/CotA-like multicopper oxidase with cupredoxin domain
MKKNIFFLSIISIVLLIGFGAFFIINEKEKAAQSPFFSQESNGRSEANSPQTVSLKNNQRYTLTANIVKKNIKGAEVKMLAYNGSIPGPIIKVQQGSKITLTLVNNTDVPTRLHPHGVRVENKSDGTDLTQKSIPSGGSYTYTLQFPDAGIYWYHPHVREDYAQALGLYGNFLVEPKEAGYWSPVNEETPLIISDILMTNGQIVPFNKDHADHTFMGRFGNTMLVNGSTDYSQSVKSGEVVRYYITNAASTRIFNLAIPGAKIKLVGGDNGRVTNQQFVDSVMIAPSERSIIDVYFERSGTFSLISKTPQRTYSLGRIMVKDSQIGRSYQSAFDTLRVNQDISTEIPNMDDYYAKPEDKSLKIEANIAGMSMSSGSNHMMSDGQMMQGDMNMEGMDMGGSAKIEWEDTMSMMNENATPANTKWELIDQQTNKVNDEIGWKFKRGDLVKFALFNDPNGSHPMQHPIHIHGNRFIVLDTNGVRNENPQWKDTVLVQSGDTVHVLVEMSNPGKWMIHCHIPEHLESGMMSEFTVI